MSRASAATRPSTLDTTTHLGPTTLRSPLLAASGTAGHGAELAGYLDLASLGAVTAKSLSVDPWPGNPAPRVHGTPAGMLNSVGLQGPGIEQWLRTGLVELVDAGATVVASVWGSTVEDYRRAAAALVAGLDRTTPGVAGAVVGIEVNVSCPNHHDGGRMFAQSAPATAEVIAVVAEAVAPRRQVRPEFGLWAKLTPATADLVEIAGAASEAGADAVTLINTVPGLVIDVEDRRPLLAGGRGGGLSGPAIHPVAVRCVYDVHAALPTLPIVGTGGVATGTDVVELLLAGASAVGVGTASFAEPRALARIGHELEHWCDAHGVRGIAELIGGAHG